MGLSSATGLFCILFLTTIAGSVSEVGGVSRREDRQSTSLSISPSGPVVEGSSVTIACRAPPGVKQPFDILRIVRMIDGRTVDITNNNLLGDIYRQTGRYRVASWDDDQGHVELSIEHIQGIDGGNIGCRLLTESPSKPSDVFTDLIVAVPPRRVEFLYQSPGGSVYHASEFELVRLPQGLQTIITCRVTTADTDFIPDVYVTSDGNDVTSQFVQNSTTDDDASITSSSRDGFARFAGRIYEYQLKVDPTESDVASLVHGKNLSCSAYLPHFRPVVASVRLEVAYKPRVQCERGGEYNGRVGQTGFEVVCSGRSHPSPQRVVWSWAAGADDASDVIVSQDDSGSNGVTDRVEIFNGVINRKDLQTLYYATYSDASNGEFKFRLFISKLEVHDFHSYDLEVSNEVGSTLVTFRISQTNGDSSKSLATPKAQSATEETRGDQPSQLKSTNGGSPHCQPGVWIAALVFCSLQLTHFSRISFART